MSQKHAKKAKNLSLSTQFEHLKKQVQKGYKDFKKSIQKNIKKPQSRVAEFVILFLVVGILFSLFSLVDGLLQAYIKAFEEEEATIEAYLEKDEEECSTGEVTYNLMAKIGESDNNTVRIKSYEVSLDLDSFQEVTDRDIEFEIGEDADDVSDYEEGVIRGFIEDDEHVMTEGGEADTFFKITAKKEDYGADSMASCYLGSYSDTDYTNLLDSIHDAYRDNQDYITYVSDTILDQIPDDTIVTYISDIVEDEEFADNSIVRSLRGDDDTQADQAEDDTQSISKDDFIEALQESEDVVDSKRFVGELLDRIGREETDDLQDVVDEAQMDEDALITIRTRASTFYSKQLDQHDEFEIVEHEVVGKGEGSGGSGSDDEDTDGGSGGGDDEADSDSGSNDDSSDSGSDDEDTDGGSGGGDDEADSDSGSDDDSSDSGSDDEDTDGGSGGGDDEADSDSGSDDDSSDSGSDDDDDGGKGVGSGYECKERPEKGDSPEGVCGCIGEDCGFGSSDDNRYDWRCCHRAWGPCEQDGKRSCITVFGEGQSHACEVGKVEECVPQSQVDEVQDRKDSLFCEGEPPNIAQPADAAGKPSCFLRDGDNWVTCATNEKCREVGEKTGANWCYGGYCGRP